LPGNVDSGAAVRAFAAQGGKQPVLIRIQIKKVYHTRRKKTRNFCMESRLAQRLFFVRPAERAASFGGDGMDAAIWDCPIEWAGLLPAGTRRVRRESELTEHLWPLLALTPGACRALEGRGIVCRLLLAPGDCCPGPEWVRAETVISYGLSPRDSLTLSSLTEPVLCVQRSLPRLDGEAVDPQELPLPLLPGPAEALLPVLGLRLLQMPLAEPPFLW